MHDSDDVSEELAELVSQSDRAGVARLMERQRDRLKRMIRARLDPRLAARVDPSDLVQETLAEAVRKIPDYLRDCPLPFYPWLRQLATRHLTRAGEHHVRTQRRSVDREQHPELGLSSESVSQLAERFVATGTSPTAQAVRAETQAQVRAALARLPYVDREVLVLRFIEQLSTRETAAILGITPEAVGMRRLRALRQLSQELGEPP